MDLVVAGLDLPLRINQERPIGKAPVRIPRFQPKRPDQQPDARLSRHIPQGGEGDVIVFVLQNAALVVAAGRDAVRDLGREDKRRPLRRGIAHHLYRARQIAGRCIADVQLDQRRLHQEANKASSLPARSSA